MILGKWTDRVSDRLTVTDVATDADHGKTSHSLLGVFFRGFQSYPRDRSFSLYRVHSESLANPCHSSTFPDLSDFYSNKIDVYNAGRYSLCIHSFVLVAAHFSFAWTLLRRLPTPQTAHCWGWCWTGGNICPYTSTTALVFSEYIGVVNIHADDPWWAFVYATSQISCQSFSFSLWITSHHQYVFRDTNLVLLIVIGWGSLSTSVYSHHIILPP